MWYGDQVVARLDGMPLAIELAAARVEALGLGQLLDRLDDRFTLLTSSARTAPARQRSLAATVDWSYQLLSDLEKQVFRRLAIFSGPFTTPHQEAAQAPPELARLSAREQELVTLVARGSTDAQIAVQLYISVSTVRSHLDRIRDKTSCRRRADLTRLALQTGLV